MKISDISYLKLKINKRQKFPKMVIIYKYFKYLL